ncbi:MAG: acetyl-CoA carboxylase biotin carboxyl carrier protein [Clostridia bacterium]|nr:acetyl-CoA carboxylase biotin carboxyl carrier protein [Clostridia bacterium]
MNETEIRKYAELMRELGLTGLEFTGESGKVRLERSAPVAGSVYAVPEASPAAAAPAENPVPRDCISVKSPLVGVFYAAPAENAAPYVTIGDRVKKGQILCIVEAMKLMNEITAEEDGIITEVCVTNGQMVEYGKELFRIKKETL